MIASLSVDALANRCAEENYKYNHQQESDSQYCFELLRRALVNGLSDALTHVFKIFEGQARNWVYRHGRFVQSGEDADYFVNLAFTKFYFALRGARFEQFPALPQVLRYLKVCVHSAIAQYVRDQVSFSEVSLDEIEPAYTPDHDSHISAHELWNHICRLLPDEQDRLLAECTFIQRLKPAQIAHIYPRHWNTVRDISVALQRIRRILRNDVELRQQAGIDSQNS
jgi:hypothetical protein